jgi:phosphoketolase
MSEHTLSPELLSRMDAYWRAANYLSVGQIYLQDNPLLKEPLALEHVKPMLHIRRFGQDMPEVRNWKWGASSKAE